VAVVPFAEEVAGLEVDVAKIIEEDLLRSGRFDIVPRNRLLSNPSSSDEVTFTDWRSTNVEYLVIGSVKGGVGGQLEVDFELVDIVRQSRLLADTPTEQGQVNYCCRYLIGARQLRRTAHTISNLVYEEVVGVRGVFDTQFAYITSTGSKDQQRYALELADIDGQNVVRVLEISRPILSPTWSPDGEQLAYVSFEFSGRTAIIVHHLARAERRKLISIECLSSPIRRQSKQRQPGLMTTPSHSRRTAAVRRKSIAKGWRVAQKQPGSPSMENTMQVLRHRRMDRKSRSSTTIREIFALQFRIWTQACWKYSLTVDWMNRPAFHPMAIKYYTPQRMACEMFSVW